MIHERRIGPGPGAALLCGALSLLPLQRGLGQEVAIHTVHVQHSGRDVEVRVNGLPVARAESARPSLIAQLSSFLTDGSNRIELVSVRRGSTTSPLSFAVRRRTAEGEAVVASLPDLEDEAAGEQVVRAVEVEVTLPVSWSWERADDLGTGALAPTEREAILVAVGELHGDLAAGRADAAVDRLRILYREMGLLRPGIVDRIRGQVQGWMRDPNWRIESLDPDELEIRSYGRLVHVTADSPVVESGPLGDGDSRFRLASMFLARIDGRWEIVRRGP